MKFPKKISAVILTLILIFAMSATALADSTTGSITIDNAVTGKTYKIYRIFDLNSYNEGYTALNYKVNSKWSGFFSSGANGLNYVTIDSQGYVTWKDGKTAADFAADAIKYATDSSIANDGTITASSATVEFDNLTLGYYLVQSDLGALCSLDTTTPNVTIKEKNAKPTIEKQVQEDSTDTYGKTNDADIGQNVNFKTTVNVIDGQPKSYVVHDTMSAGLTFNADSVKVTVNDAEINTGYTVVTTNLTDGDTFEVQFTDGTLKANDVVVITYSAMVNANAVIGGVGNPNTTKLSYTDTTGTTKTTAESKTVTYTWQIDVFKFTKNNDNETPLAGAKFVLYKGATNNITYAKTDGNSKITEWVTNKTDATVFTTPENGKFSIKGLDADTYYLEEAEAPAGYNTLEEPVKVTIESVENNNARTATVKYGATSTGEVKVENETGSKLPTTGGIGTTVFYIIGGAMVVIAGVILVTRKRMNRKES